MQYVRFVLAILVILHSQVATAQELVPLSASTPQLAAVVEWHRTLMAGDFAAYKRSIAEAQAQATSRNEFDEMRKWTPEMVKVSVPRALPNGNFELTALGCKQARRQAVSIVVVKSTLNWKILSTGWAQVWGSEAKSCPI